MKSGLDLSHIDQGINDAAILALTKRINGGTHGLDDRKMKTKKYAAWL